MDSSWNSSLDETGREFSSITEQEAELYAHKKLPKGQTEEQAEGQQRIDSDVDTQPPEPKVKKKVYSSSLMLVQVEKPKRVNCSVRDLQLLPNGELNILWMPKNQKRDPVSKDFRRQKSWTNFRLPFKFNNLTIWGFTGLFAAVNSNVISISSLMIWWKLISFTMRAVFEDASDAQKNQI